MKADNYTKTMLTIIAACLLWISIALMSSQDLVRTASAQPQGPGKPVVQQVLLTGIAPGFALPVNLVAVDGVNKPVPVSIFSVNTKNGAVPVDLTFLGGAHNPLPVTIAK
jgi:hypothetical protein